MTSNTQEFQDIAGSDAQRARSAASTEPATSRRDADDNDADIRGVAVLGYN